MSAPPYPEYKDSGVEWLGRVPTHWKVSPLARLATTRCDGPFGSGLKSEHYRDDGARVIRLQNIRLGEFDDGDSVFIDVEYFRRELMGHEVVAGDLLIAGLGDDNNVVGRACVAPHNLGPSLVKADCFRFRLNPALVDPKFAAWQLSAGAVAEGARLAKGITRQRIPLSNMGARRLAVPPLAEQIVVTKFLNSEIAKIDALVAEQHRLVELLTEKRRATISRAVTKGVDPSAPMKNSGISWMGEVPKHWTVTPIRFAARLESGHTPSRNHPEYWENCTVPWFTLADVWQIRQERRDVILETKELISELGLANSAARLLPIGTVMLSRTASVGFSAIMGVPMATTQDFANWVCGEALRPEYLLQVLRSMEGEFRRLMMGSTHNTIYMPDIQSLRFGLPPLDEQDLIVECIRGVVVESDAFIVQARRSTELLEERRSAMIFAAVTGQIDVRGLVDREAA